MNSEIGRFAADFNKYVQHCTFNNGLIPDFDREMRWFENDFDFTFVDVLRKCHPNCHVFNALQPKEFWDFFLGFT